MEKKIEKEDNVLGDFLSNNLAACNLASFHDLVGWSKERFNRIIDKIRNTLKAETVPY